MQKWEYIFMTVIETDQDPAPSKVNGEELHGWEKGRSVYEYANRLGEDGWELVSTQSTGTLSEYTLIFKRPK